MSNIMMMVDPAPGPAVVIYTSAAGTTCKTLSELDAEIRALQMARRWLKKALADGKST